MEDDADFVAIGIERGDVVGQRLVMAAMPLVLRAVARQVLVELADHVLGDGDLLEGIEHLIHHVGATRDLLLIAGFKIGDVRAAKQILHVTVGELRSLDLGGRYDTLNGGNLAKRGEFLRRKTADQTPLPLEFIEFGDEPVHHGPMARLRGLPPRFPCHASAKRVAKKYAPDGNLRKYSPCFLFFVGAHLHFSWRLDFNRRVQTDEMAMVVCVKTLTTFLLGGDQVQSVVNLTTDPAQPGNQL